MKVDQLVQRTSQDVGDHSRDTSELGPTESVGLGSLSADTTALDDAILRAQGHKAAMPRVFSVLSSLGLGFRYDSSPSLPRDWKCGRLTEGSQHHQFMGRCNEQLRTEHTIRRATVCHLRPSGRYVRAVDHHTGIVRAGLCVSLFRSKCLAPREACCPSITV
jgi:hypothetical protein